MPQEQQKPYKQLQIEQLRRAIKKGIQQADRGELVGGEAVFSSIRAKSHARRRSQQKHT